MRRILSVFALALVTVAPASAQVQQVPLPVVPSILAIRFGSPVDTGLSRISAGVLGIGNGTAGDYSGTVKAGVFLAGDGTGSADAFAFYNESNTGMFRPGAGLIRFGILGATVLTLNATTLATLNSPLQINGALSSVNGVSTTGSYGVDLTVANARATAQTGANASVTTYTCTADCTVLVSANVLVTASVTHNFQVTVAYTDEGNTARTFIIPFETIGAGGTPSVNITNANGTLPYMSMAYQIRSKANVAVTIATTGTFTSVTYNVEGLIRRIS